MNLSPRFHHAARLCGSAWPLEAHAQQPAKLPTIGLLGSSTPSAMSQWVAAFVQRLRELGWIEGRTVAIEYRWAEGRSERFAEIAAGPHAIQISGASVLARRFSSGLGRLRTRRDCENRTPEPDQ